MTGPIPGLSTQYPDQPFYVGFRRFRCLRLGYLTAMDEFLDDRAPDAKQPTDKRVRSRAKTIRREHPRVEDAEAAAEELLKESDARTDDDPAPRNLREGRVERRTSEDATPPPGPQ